MTNMVKSHRLPDGQPQQEISAILNDVFQRLLAAYGPQHWWPGETPFEVMVGAILTQSAAWSNVEKAICNLKAKGLLTPAALRNVALPLLAETIRPSGYFNVKAKKLKELVNWLATYRDNIDLLRTGDLHDLRAELLSVYGVGEETADSILLYACGRPMFVIDAYTVRVTGRLGITPEQRTYAGWQSHFMENLTNQVALFNEYHALLVIHGKNTCRKKPQCTGCCLSKICQSSGHQS